MHKPAIKVAALALFKKVSFSKTAIKDIAAACDLGKGTIYLYFESKDAILLSIVDDHLTILESEYRERFADPRIDRLTKLATFLDILIDEYFTLKDLLFGNFENVETRMLRDIFQKFDSYRPWFVRFLQRLCEGESYGAKDPTELMLRFNDYIDLVVGRFILYTIRNDWSNREGLRQTVKPLALSLYKNMVEK